MTRDRQTSDSSGSLVVFSPPPESRRRTESSTDQPATVNSALLNNDWRTDRRPRRTTVSSLKNHCIPSTKPSSTQSSRTSYLQSSGLRIDTSIGGLNGFRKYRNSPVSSSLIQSVPVRSDKQTFSRSVSEQTDTLWDMVPSPVRSEDAEFQTDDSSAFFSPPGNGDTPLMRLRGSSSILLHSPRARNALLYSEQPILELQRAGSSTRSLRARPWEKDDLDVLVNIESRETSIEGNQDRHHEPILDKHQTLPADAVPTQHDDQKREEHARFAALIDRLQKSAASVYNQKTTVQPFTRMCHPHDAVDPAHDHSLQPSIVRLDAPLKDNVKEASLRSSALNPKAPEFQKLEPRPGLPFPTFHKQHETAPYLYPATGLGLPPVVNQQPIHNGAAGDSQIVFHPESMNSWQEDIRDLKRCVEHISRQIDTISRAYVEAGVREKLRASGSISSGSDGLSEAVQSAMNLFSQDQLLPRLDQNPLTLISPPGFAPLPWNLPAPVNTQQPRPVPNTQRPVPVAKSVHHSNVPNGGFCPTGLSQGQPGAPKFHFISEEIHSQNQRPTQVVHRDLSRQPVNLPVPTCFAGPQVVPGLTRPTLDQVQAMFGPKPVRKPKGPGRVGGQHHATQQQQYEAYLEWKRTSDRAYAQQCKDRQAKRAARTSLSDGATASAVYV